LLLHVLSLFYVTYLLVVLVVCFGVTALKVCQSFHMPDSYQVSGILSMTSTAHFSTVFTKWQHMSASHWHVQLLLHCHCSFW